MWRYILMFLLVNTCGRSLGIPVTSKVWIPNLFNNLAKGCKNEFVSTQIAIKTKDCNVTTPPLHDVQFRCLVFYDASSLLCNVSSSSHPNIATDFTVKTSEKYNVSSFCGEAAHFSIPQTSNQKLMTQIFQGDVLCKNVCVDEDILTGDTNFVCKYYKWMLGVLQAATTPLHATDTLADTSGKASATELKLTSAEGKLNEVTTPNANNTSSAVKQPELDIKKDGSSKELNIPQQQSGNAVSGIDHSTEQLAGSQGQAPNQTKIVKDPKNVQPKVDKIEETETHLHLPGGAESDPAVVAEKDTVVKDAVIENPQLGGVDDEESDDPGADGDDNREDNIDAEGEDNENHGGDVEVRPNNQGNPPGNQVETQMTFNEGSQRDIFPNAMSDAFPEDDDHFFPFFLTAVIVVVVLYVLYHNKNKVGKMFFGLIVEGRQPGRRRNSRGHAYRRLDTLEQAMSANTPAPPSKIIY